MPGCLSAAAWRWEASGHGGGAGPAAAGRLGSLGDGRAWIASQERQPAAADGNIQPPLRDWPKRRAEDVRDDDKRAKLRARRGRGTGGCRRPGEGDPRGHLGGGDAGEGGGRRYRSGDRRGRWPPAPEWQPALRGFEQRPLRFSLDGRTDGRRKQPRTGKDGGLGSAKRCSRGTGRPKNWGRTWEGWRRAGERSSCLKKINVMLLRMEAQNQC